MKIVKFTLLVLFGAAVLHGCLAVFAAACAHADPAIAGAWQPVTAAPAVGDALGFEGKLAAYSVVLYTLGRLVLEVLKVRAPQTATKWDDYARDALARVLGERTPAPAAVVAVVQPAPPRDPQAGVARTLVLTVLSGVLIGAAVGAIAVSCATVKRGTAAGKYAGIECIEQDGPAIAGLLARFGVQAAIGGFDRKAFETAALGSALGVASCAYGEFLREYQRLGKDQVATRSLVATADPVVELQAMLAQASGGAPVRLADGTVVQ